MKKSVSLQLFHVLIASILLPLSHSTAQERARIAQMPRQQVVQMPPLVGKDVAVAERELRQLFKSLQIEKTAVEDNRLSPGQVVRQIPAPQTALYAETKVTLYYRKKESRPSVNWGEVIGGVAGAVGEALKETEVPDVRGRSVRDARQVLKRKRLGASIQSQDDEVETLLVTDQSPTPGRKVSIGSSVQLTIGRPQQDPRPTTRRPVAPKPIPVPDVTGDKLSEASERLERVELASSISGYEEASRGWGRVLRQSPTPGTPVNKGTVVSLVIAVQPKLIPVPDVRNVSPEQAKQVLIKDGLKPGYVVGAAANLPGAIVVKQFPEPRSMVERGSSVRLEVAAPTPTPTPKPTATPTPIPRPTATATPTPTVTPTPRLVPVPDLLMQSRQAVEARLRNANLALGQESTRPSSFPTGVVIEQQPLPGAQVVPGSLVNVVFAAPPQTPVAPQILTPAQPPTRVTGSPTPTPTPVIVPDVRKRDLAEAINQLRAARLNVGEVTQEESSAAPNSVLIQQPLPGGTVAADSRVNLVTAKPAPAPLGGFIKEVGGILAVLLTGLFGWGIARLLRKPPKPSAPAPVMLETRVQVDSDLRIEPANALSGYLALSVIPKADEGRQYVAFPNHGLVIAESKEYTS